jgi:hypothetical protein
MASRTVSLRVGVTVVLLAGADPGREIVVAATTTTIGPRTERRDEDLLVDGAVGVGGTCGGTNFAARTGSGSWSSPSSTPARTAIWSRASARGVEYRL